MPKPLLLVRVLFLLLGACSIASAQYQSTSTQPVLFKHPLASQLVARGSSATETFSALQSDPQKQRFFIRFHKIPNAAQQQQLAAKGIELLEFIPGNTYLARIDHPVSAVELSAMGINGIFRVPVEIKKDIATNTAARSTSRQTKNTWHIWFTGGLDSSAAVHQMQRTLGKETPDPAEIRVLYHRMLEVKITGAALEKLLEEPYVLYALPVPELFELNLNGTESHFANSAHLGANGIPGLTGKGVTLGIGDGGRIYHIDHNYYEEGQLYNGNVHATHVAGTMAGKGHINPVMRGFAYDASLEVDYFNTIIFQTPSLYQQKRMVITNNSYGAGSSCLPYSGQYSGYCGQADQQLLDMPHLMHVFAAGNARTLQCGDYPVSYRSIDNAFQAAKNVLTVGGTNENGTINVYSKGPTMDGRIKPEVVSISTNVLSSTSNNNYGRLDGTSMACPQVSGSLALLYERYRQLFNGTDPEGALMKALVCNTATDLGTPYVDFANGFGWLNIRKALETLNKKQWISGKVAHQEEQVMEIQLDREVTDFRIMLYWHDRPASFYSAKALVNDLDITVELPDGTVYDPYVLDTSAAGVLNQATRGKDHLNNIEQVVIDRAIPGRYRIRVKGFEIPYGPQDFKIVYNWDEPGLQLLQPVGGELYKPGEQRVIQWTFPGQEMDSYSFAYSIDNGTSWTPIATGLTQPGRRTWTVPATVQTAVLVKLTHESSGQERISAPFRILPELSFTVSSTCESRGLIRWSPSPGIDSVAVLMFNGTEMETLAITTDTSYQVDGLKTGKPFWFTLQPVLNGILGERSVAKRLLTTAGICTGTGMAGDLSLQVPASHIVSRAPSAKDSLDQLIVQIRNEGSVPIQDTVLLSLLKNDIPLGTDTIFRRWNPAQPFTWTTRLRPSGLPGETATLKLILSIKGDGNTLNDTAAINWRYLVAAPIELPYEDNMEQVRDTSIRIPGYPGLPGFEAWDAGITAASLNLESRSKNGLFISSKIDGQSLQLIGNYNFENYSIADDIRMALDIPDFGQLKMDCFIRGSDTSSWLGVALLDPMTQQPDIDYLNLSEVLAKHGQEFSSSFQVRFRFIHSSYQQQLQVLKKLRFFKAEEDISLLYFVYQKPQVTDGDSVICYLWARNNRQSASGGVRFGIETPDGNNPSFQLSSIAAGDTGVVAFKIPVLNWPEAVASLKAWIHAEADQHRADDSLTATWAYAPKVDQFPYLEGFEQGKSGWGSTFLYEHSSRLNESIAPFKPANGNAFWGTQWIASVQGIGFIIPSGYLVSPLFDLSQLKKPYLSASVNRQLCDGRDSVFLEYSIDTGRTWIRLLNQADEVNWYNDPAKSAWMECDPAGTNQWRLITSALPTNLKTVQFRLLSLARNDQSNVMPRKPGGFLLDDFHIYDRVYPLLINSSATLLNLPLNGASYVPALSNGQLFAELKPAQNVSGSVQVRFSELEGEAAFGGNKVLPYNWSLLTGTSSLVADGRLRLYLSDDKIQSWLTANPCDTCTTPLSAYDLSVFRYAGPVSTINQRLSDNGQGYETVWDPSGFDLVPYDKGYYLELPVGLYGEFYLGHNTTMAMLDFQAIRSGKEKESRLNWTVANWKGVERIELERSNRSDAGFLPLASFTINSGTPLSGTYTDRNLAVPGTYYYRLKLIYSSGNIRYSAIRVVQFDSELQVQVYPNPGKGEQMKLKLTRLEGASVQLELTDITGKRLAATSTGVGSGIQWINLAPLTGGLPAGIYVLRVSAGEQKKTLRLVISGN